MIPRSLCLSKVCLQSLANGLELRKHQLFSVLLNDVVQAVLKSANSGETSYVFILEHSKTWDRIVNLLKLIDINVFTSEFVNILKKEFDGCSVNYTNNAEHQYTIDWS